MNPTGWAAIVGAGRIGRALGAIITSSAHPLAVRFWDSQPGLVPDQQPLPTVVRGATVVILAVPARALPSLAETLDSLLPTVCFITISKGVPSPGYLSPAEYLQAHYPRHSLVVMGGPMMAEEMSATNPGHAVIASTNNHTVHQVSRVFHHEYIDLTVSYDPVSVSRAGVLKNVYGYISGMLDGFDIDATERGAIRSWLVAEYTTTASSLGVSSEIINGPAGLGDLAVTMASPNSRNRRAGEMLVRKNQRDERSEAVHSLIDVARSLPAGVDAPLLRTAEQLLQNTITTRDVLPRFTKHLPKAGPLYGLGARSARRKTVKKEYGTLPSGMPHDPSLPPSHAALLKEYETAGFHHVHIRHDAPKAVYPPHYHPDHVVLHVLEGELDVEVDGEHQIVPAGKKIDVAAERFHTTCVGPQGCIYLHAEKHVTSS